MKELFREDEKIAYYASDDGKIFSLQKKSGKWRELKPGKDRNGYLRFYCYQNGKAKYIPVHRAVYEAFHGPVPQGLEINHKNCVRDDNHLENLELVSHSENQNHPPSREHAREAHRWQMKRVVDVTTGAVYESTIEAARQTGLHQGNISNCCNGKCNTVGGHTFKFAS